MTTLVVYKNRDNPPSAEFREDGVLMDFTAVTRMTLELRGAGVTLDTDVDASLIDWSQGGGKVQFNIADENLAPGTYRGRLVAYDAGHPDGQVLTHDKSGPFLSFAYKAA